MEAFVFVCILSALFYRGGDNPIRFTKDEFLCGGYSEEDSQGF